MLSKKINKYRRIVSAVLIIVLIVSAVVVYNYKYLTENRRDANHAISLIEVKHAIDNAISFLSENQLPSGEFVTYQSYFIDMGNGTYIRTLFITMFVVHALKFVDQLASVQQISDKGLAFLMSQKEETYLWKFYGKNSTEYLQSLGVADLFDFPDMDDTCLALMSFKDNNVEYDEKIMDYLLNFTNEGGVFYTWIKDDGGYNDIDEVVNANILYFFSSHNIQLPKVCKFLNKLVENNLFKNGSIYYTSPYAFTYAFTRAYSEGNATCLNSSIPKIQRFLIEMQVPNGGWNNELETALATISLMNSDYREKEVDMAIQYLIAKQDIDGSWPIAPFFIGGNFNPMVRFGSEELTTAFCLEALAKYYNKYL